jgi:hypothetical protein
MNSVETPSSHDEQKPQRKLTLREHIEANRGAGYGAMIGAIAGAILMGPMTPVGAIVGGAIG